MPVEEKRGCGYRTVDSTYLVCEGTVLYCDRLPLFLEACRCCGYEVPWPNPGFLWIKKEYIGEHKIPLISNEQKEMVSWREPCGCNPNCVLCHPDLLEQDRFGFMWVGKRYYTPESFRREAETMGVSKKISQIPTGLEFGKTWVLLGHAEVPIDPAGSLDTISKKEPEKKKAIFYAFKPSAIEKLIWESEATPKKLKELEKQGYTPVVIPDGEKDHASRRGR